MSKSNGVKDMWKSKKSHKKRGLKLVLAVVVAYFLALTVPYIPHKKVSQEFQEKFSPQEVYGDETGTERVAYIDDNQEALLLRLRMIEEAEEEVILSTFDFRSEESGKDVMAALLHAADRGVSVRVIIDGISGFMSVRNDPYFLALARNENIQLRIYNPVNLLKPWKMQARLHDKYVIVDDKMYLLGGRNTYDLFVGDCSDTPNIDRELFVLEEEERDDTSLAQVKSYFEQVWALSDSRDFLCKKETDEIRECTGELKNRYEELKKIYPSAWEKQDWEAYTMEANKVTLLTNPIEAENKEPWMWYCLTELMKTGNQVTVLTPYIICGQEMYQDMRDVCQNVSSLEILTNDVASGANPWGCTDYMNQKKKIWNTGVQVYEYLGGHSMHTKAMVVDDRLSVVGSYNMDMRSTYQDTEMMLAVDSKELNALIRSQAESDKTYSRTMRDGEYEMGENYQPVEMSMGKRIFYGVLRVLIIPIRRFL